MNVTLRILGQDIVVDCAPGECRRLEDLGKALAARLEGYTGDANGMRQLALTALSLMAEAQASAAAVVRAHSEIELLNDMIAEARIEVGETLAPVSSLFASRVQGAA